MLFSLERSGVPKFASQRRAAFVQHGLKYWIEFAGRGLISLEQVVPFSMAMTAWAREVFD